jgi:hypothetical protein
MMPRAAWVPVAVVMLLVLGRASGEALTFQAQGVLDYVHDPGDQLDFDVGDAWTLTYTFDTETEDTNPDPDLGSYPAIDTVLNVGGIVLPTASPAVQVTNDLPSDIRDIYRVFMALPGFPDELATMNLIDEDGTIFSDDSLPLAPPELGEFESATLLIVKYGTPETEYLVQGPVHVLIPEPGSAGLAVICAVLLFRRRGA